MSLLGPDQGVVPEPSDEQVAVALAEIKRHARHQRLALTAPLALAVAVLTAFVAGPQEHGGLALLPEADASDQAVLPRVFGANGVWRLAEPITEAATDETSPPTMIGVPETPDAPVFALEAPAETGMDSELEALPLDSSSQSLPASASSPPTPTLGQQLGDDIDPTGPDVDFTDYQADIRFVAPDPGPGETASAPVTPAPAEVALVPTDASAPDQAADDDVADTQAVSDTTGDAVAAMLPADADTAVTPEANPSTPQPEPADQVTQPESAVATIVTQSVLVYSAHVSVEVRVVDDDSSVIDWCNTRVDWGDGSVTGLNGPDGVAACAASCELEATPSEVKLGIDETIVFSHEYTTIIDAAPRIFVATGDGCSYTLAEHQLNPFTVVPF